MISIFHFLNLQLFQIRLNKRKTDRDGGIWETKEQCRIKQQIRACEHKHDYQKQGPLQSSKRQDACGQTKR